ncbi:MAG: ComF family protein [Clostridiales bacterium]|nr:ComF family protein [Clostridiales bacterium]
MDKACLYGAAKKVIRYLFPNVCMICRRVLVSGVNCSSSTRSLQICTHCLSQFPLRRSSERWFSCLSDPYESDPIPQFQVWALFHYEMPVTMLLRQLKFHSRRYCGTLVGELMGQEFPGDLPVKPDAVVPVPLSDQRLRKRGYNQAEVLGMGLSASLGVPILPEVLRRTRNTKQQSRYSEPEMRQKNVRGAFALGKDWDISGWNILLVDDILTTGATLHEAAKLLYEHGAACVIGVVAATHRELEETDSVKRLYL